jgi:hypothetical protein
MKAILEFQIKDVYYSENELIAKSLFKEEAFVLY